MYLFKGSLIPISRIDTYLRFEAEALNLGCSLFLIIICETGESILVLK